MKTGTIMNRARAALELLAREVLLGDGSNNLIPMDDGTMVECECFYLRVEEQIPSFEPPVVAHNPEEILKEIYRNPN